MEISSYKREHWSVKINTGSTRHPNVSLNVLYGEQDWPEGSFRLALMRIEAQGGDGKMNRGRAYTYILRRTKRGCISIGIHRSCLTQKPHLCLNDTINSNELKRLPSTFSAIDGAVTDGACRPRPHSVQAPMKCRICIMYWLSVEPDLSHNGGNLWWLSYLWAAEEIVKQN